MRRLAAALTIIFILAPFGAAYAVNSRPCCSLKRSFHARHLRTAIRRRRVVRIVTPSERS
jgi:hypothetical protein